MKLWENNNNYKFLKKSRTLCSLIFWKTLPYPNYIWYKSIFCGNRNPTRNLKLQSSQKQTKLLQGGFPNSMDTKNKLELNWNISSPELSEWWSKSYCHYFWIYEDNSFQITHLSCKAMFWGRVWSKCHASVTFHFSFLKHFSRFLPQFLLEASNLWKGSKPFKKQWISLKFLKNADS